MRSHGLVVKGEWSKNRILAHDTRWNVIEANYHFEEKKSNKGKQFFRLGLVGFGSHMS